MTEHICSTTTTTIPNLYDNDLILKTYIQTKLGQNFIDCESNLHEGVLYYKFNHLRFNYDAENTNDERLQPDLTLLLNKIGINKNENCINKRILELFIEHFKNKRVVLKTWKGIIDAYIVEESDYKKYYYWEHIINCSLGTGICKFTLPFVLHLPDLHGLGTVGIIMKLIKTINAIVIEQKIKKNEWNLIREQKLKEKQITSSVM